MVSSNALASSLGSGVSSSLQRRAVTMDFSISCFMAGVNFQDRPQQYMKVSAGDWLGISQLHDKCAGRVKVRLFSCFRRSPARTGGSTAPAIRPPLCTGEPRELIASLSLKAPVGDFGTCHAGAAITDSVCQISLPSASRCNSSRGWSSLSPHQVWKARQTGLYT
jgi:hypothetical protein